MFFWKRAKPKPTRPMLYIVRWKADMVYHDSEDDGAPPLGNRVTKAFGTQAAAEQYRQAVQRGQLAPPAGANPFIGFRVVQRSWIDAKDVPKLADLTTMPEPIFDDWLRDLGLTPPVPQQFAPKHGTPFQARDWNAWWETNVATMTDQQRRKVWEGLNKLDFFEIVATECEE